MSWRSTIVAYNPSSKLAEKNLIDPYGQNLYGCQSVKFKSVFIKLLNNINIVAVLCSNLVTDVELTSSGKVQKIFAPIKIFELSGRKNQRIVINIDQSECFNFTGISNVKFWITDFETNKCVDLDLNVHCLYRTRSSE